MVSAFSWHISGLDWNARRRSSAATITPSIVAPVGTPSVIGPDCQVRLMPGACGGAADDDAVFAFALNAADHVVVVGRHWASPLGSAYARCW